MKAEALNILLTLTQLRAEGGQFAFPLPLWFFEKFEERVKPYFL